MGGKVSLDQTPPEGVLATGTWSDRAGDLWGGWAWHWGPPLRCIPAPHRPFPHGAQETLVLAGGRCPPDQHSLEKVGAGAQVIESSKKLVKLILMIDLI